MFVHPREFLSPPRVVFLDFLVTPTAPFIIAAQVHTTVYIVFVCISTPIFHIFAHTRALRNQINGVLAVIVASSHHLR
jgi:hypothetical protein